MVAKMASLSGFYGRRSGGVRRCLWTGRRNDGCAGGSAQ